MEKIRTSAEADKKAMGVWIVKQFRKLSVIDSGRAEEFKFDRKAGQHENFIQFLKHLSSLVDSCEKDYSEEATEAGDLTARDSARVTRIMFKKLSKNSLNEDSDE